MGFHSRPFSYTQSGIPASTAMVREAAKNMDGTKRRKGLSAAECSQVNTSTTRNVNN